jgi:O-antigen/teichoic acid export membrane protein
VPRGSGPNTGAHVSIWRRVRRDVALLGTGSVGIVIAQLGFRSILITALVPADYGRLSLILSVYNTLFIIGASGLPNSAARYISLIAPGDDSGIVRSALRAAIWPTVVSSVVIAVVAGVLLRSPIACVFAAVGLASLVYSLLATGILRGRGRVVAAASIIPIAGASEFGLLAVVWLSGLSVTPLSAFGLFCLGNFVGVVAGGVRVLRTRPAKEDSSRPSTAIPRETPTSRELLGFSMWLGAATVGVAVMPLALRFAAALDSYQVVAIVDVALVLLSIPQRIGTVIVQAVIPHATRAVANRTATMTISRREHYVMIVPFVLCAVLVEFTPVVGWVFDALGRPSYSKGADYLALAFLAGPARILYGLVQGILIAHGDGRFVGLSALSTTAVASGLIVAAVALGSTAAAFGIFVVACWVVYLWGLRRIHRLPVSGQTQASPGAVV